MLTFDSIINLSEFSDFLTLSAAHDVSNYLVTMTEVIINFNFISI